MHLKAEHNNISNSYKYNHTNKNSESVCKQSIMTSASSPCLHTKLPKQ